MNTQELKGQWNTIRGKVKEKWGQLTDDDLQIAGGDFHQLIGTIQQRTGETRQQIEEYLSSITEGGQDAMQQMQEQFRRASEMAQQGMGQAREAAQRGIEMAEKWVESRPAESLAAILGLGLITGVVVGLLLRSEA
ncbi:MAG TPA: CsbD family protein [Planctomycetaceae bacterium]|nr:CsbD family protein [Planctomycetaceae bacterium]